jgi:hypothetical protein
MIVLRVFIIAMKIPRKRKNIKKKNYGSSSIPKELAHNKWWQLLYKVNDKEKQTIYYLF